MAFPSDRYAPYGYLNLPAHTRRFRPLGVMRSWDVGFRWHMPAYAGTYGGRRETYRAGVRLALDGALDVADFAVVSSPYHTGNLVAFELRAEAVGRVAARAEYHLVGEHALRGTAFLANGPGARLALHVGYRRLLSAGGEWGESGLVGRLEDDLIVLQGFEDGDAFVLWTSSPPSDLGITTDEDRIREWVMGTAPGLPDGGYVPVLGERGNEVELHASVGLPPAGEAQEWILARGRTVAEARRHVAAARSLAGEERRRLVAADDSFWNTAPRLTGDWPEHWRRGLVYDLETLRMMVRPPIGIYRHRWDAMQIQAPRVVLAETAMDALVLAYSDPKLAQELLLGAFLDAPEPNVPCSREDGSYNMVAADGTVCGTSPAWGYPIWVAGILEGLAPDTGWLERIYPTLSRFLQWWLEHRRDSDGYLVYACSWESGQDVSPRFGDQPLGGGHPIRHIRPVDLQASVTQAAGILAGFAERLGLHGEAAEWREQERAFAERTAALWNGERWADVDARAGGPTAEDDVMLAAPLALAVARPDQAAMASTGSWLDALDADGLAWPMFAWTAIEALHSTGRADRAATIAHGIVDRAYRFRDAPIADSALPIPGICAEYWPLDGRGGGEGYGWGAFTTHLLLSTIVGLRFDAACIVLQPRLPVAWRRPGSAFGLEIRIRGRQRSIVIRPEEPDGVEIEVDGRTSRVAWGQPVELAAGTAASVT